MNDADILDYFVSYHLNQDVDRIVLMDAGSIDGTIDLIQSYGGSSGVDFVQTDPEQNRQKSDRRNRLKNYCEETYSADWIISSDVDEFWAAPGRSLKKALQQYEADDAGAVICKRCNMIAVADGNDMLTKDFAITDYTHSIGKPHIPTPEEVATGQLKFPWVFCRIGPKVAIRGGCTATVRIGGHGVVGEGLQSVASEDLCIKHFPFRSYAQFKDKVRRIRDFVAANDLKPQDAWHWQRWMNIDDRGGLEREYVQNFMLTADPKTAIYTDRLADELAFSNALTAPPTKAGLAEGC
jgi:glycosyltransferase involved in cell wall biosynthesis